MEGDVQPSEDPFATVPDPLGTAAAVAPALPRLSLALARSAPDRAQMRRRRRCALVLSLAWLTSHVAVFGLRHDLGQLPLAYLSSQVGAPLLLAFASIYVATRPGRLGLGSRLGWIAALAIGGPLSFWLIGALVPLPHAAPPEARPWLGALLCSDVMLAWMSAPLFFAAVALRGTFAAATIWRSALVGAAVGLFSGGAINLHCDNILPFHLVVGHGAPVVAAALFGAFVMVRWVRA
jgi:hypothetical protein